MRLIHNIQLPNGRTTTNLGFGCATLLRLPTERERERLLRTALELGITHFDVARFYGSGAAEGIVGAALRPVRDQVTLATKFGLPCGVPNRAKVRLHSLARWAVNLHPAVKKAAKWAVGGPGVEAVPTQAPAPHGDFSVREMTQSLEVSLGQLRTEHLDLFFLHEPWVSDELPPDLHGALEREEARGSIGGFGISGYVSELPELMMAHPELVAEAVQFNFSILKDAASQPRGGTRALTGFFSVVRESHTQVNSFLSHDEAFTRLWSARLGLDLRKHDNVALVILAIALLLNPQGLVLFATTDLNRLRATVWGLLDNSFEREHLLEFRAAIAERLATPC